MNQPSGTGTDPAFGGTAGKRALVVDDEPPLAKVVASYLERDGSTSR